MILLGSSAHTHCPLSAASNMRRFSLTEDSPNIGDGGEVDLGRMAGAVFDDFKVRGSIVTRRARA